MRGVPQGEDSGKHLDEVEGGLKRPHFLSKSLFHNLRIKEKVEKKPSLAGFRFADIMLHKVFRKSLILCVLSVCLAEVPWQG